MVGLTIIHIFGFENPEALPLAEKCGVAFQLTNILRDVKEDQRNGAASICPERGSRAYPEFHALMRFEAERARGIIRICAVDRRWCTAAAGHRCGR